MAHLAEFEAQPAAEKFIRRKPLSRPTATHFGSPATRFGKRKRIPRQVHAAFKALRTKEQQMAERLANAKRVEAELEDRQQALTTFEQRLESRLEEINKRVGSPQPSEFSAELTRAVAQTLLSSLSDKLNSLVSEKLELQRLQDQVDHDEIAALTDVNERLEHALAETSEELTLCRIEADDLRRTTDSQELEIDRLRQELAELRTLWTEGAANSTTATANDSELAALREALELSKDTIQSLRAELATIEFTRAQSDASDLEAELAQLRRQNAELSAQLAEQQSATRLNAPHLNRAHESLTWEERKRLILQQLEDETTESTPELEQHKLEVTEIMRTTQAEIERRDAEIAELRSIVEQQSNTSAGVAIGAAAIAQLVDSDELIQQEREKLRTIQKEWEDKLRQAEIELSMERAKLARERSLLEEQLRQQAALPKPEPVKTEGGKPVRKWLEHLGLRENNK